MIRFPSLRHSSRNRAPVVAALGLMLLFAAGGCQDILTYSHRSRARGLEEFRQGNYTEAAGSFQTAVEQDPRDYRSFYYLGASYDRLGSSQQAIQYYRSALRVMDVTYAGRENKQVRAEALDGLAQSIARVNQSTAALEIPDDNLTAAERQWLRGKVSRYGGDPDAAIVAYQQARMLDPDNFHLNKDFGLYMEQLGQRQLAGPALRRANALDGADEEVAAALGRLGVAPGPGLKQERELARPPVPTGPIPELEIFGNAGRREAAADTPASPPQDPSTPRDTFTPVDGAAASGPRD